MKIAVFVSAVAISGVRCFGQAPAGGTTPAAPAQAKTAAPAEGFEVREGYRVTVIIEKLTGARFLEFDDKGTLYVSRPGQGEIDTFRQATPGAEWVKMGTFVSKRPEAHGMCFHDGWMWFGCKGIVCKARDTNGDGVADEVVEVVKDLPTGGHWWRSILVTGDSFYTSIGDSGNITDETKTDRQKVWKYTLDGSSRSLFCSGIRNTEKLRLRPGTAEIWGLDHGSDWFGGPVGDKEGDQPITDLNPPDEFNHYVQDGFYGHPFVVGNRVPRYEFKDRKDIHELAAETIPPEWPVHAHWATNGFCFVEPSVNQKTHAFPADHEGDAFIACHGSWNSSEPVGYCIARVMFDHDPKLGGHPCGLVKVVSMLDGKKVNGRAADCVQAPDGSIIFSTDQPGRVYRLEWSASAPRPKLRTRVDKRNTPNRPGS